MNHGCRKCRREGVKLFLKGEKCFSPKCPVALRPYAPGQHGPTSFSKLSEYGKQLREKQKLKKVYGLNETQLKNYYKKSAQKAGNTSENLIQLLETRLDSIVYRLALAPSRSAARQLVSHRNFKIGSRRVNIPSMLISEKQQVLVGDKVKNPENKTDNISWLSFDVKKREIKVNHAPIKDELELPFDINLVIEYYSR